jgi:ribosomal protein S17E
MFDLKNNIKVKQFNVKKIRTSFLKAYSVKVKKYYGIQTVSDPVQTLRNIDFITVYYPKVMQTFQTNRKLINRMNWLKGLAFKEYFNKHAEAAKYLRKTVNGHTKKFKTPFGYRVIDAYDNYGVVNQAYLTFGEKQLLIQLKKDSWLLQNNKHVRGVVWHFFKKTEQIPKEPKSAFVHYASNNGIIIVGHVGE